MDLAKAEEGGLQYAGPFPHRDATSPHFVCLISPGGDQPGGGNAVAALL